MAGNDFDLEKEEASGGFERLLLLLIPIIFTVVLIVTLLTLFNVNVRNAAFDFLNKIPVIEKLVPDSEEAADGEQAGSKGSTAKSDEKAMEELKQKLKEQEVELQKIAEERSEQEALASELQAQLDEIQQATAVAEEEQKETEYQQEIKKLSKLYADMSPSKAAPIMQNMTQEEVVLLMKNMNSESKTAILQKMDPKFAADLTMAMKDAQESSDLEIAALQSRLKKNETAEAQQTNNTNLSETQIKQTLAGMSAKQASDLVFQMYKISPDKALTLLRSASDTTRSKVLEQMSNKDAALTAKIVNKLMGSK